MIVVQMDFDNTISVGNVSIELRNEFAPAIWREMEKEYTLGKFSVEESNVRQYALIPFEQSQIQSFVLANCYLKDGFSEFVETCYSLGAIPVIVSSGLDFYIVPLIEREGLKNLQIISAKGSFHKSGIEVNYFGPNGKQISKGFKEAYLRDFKAAGHTVIYFGDNESDFVAASEADFVFACDSLVEYCKLNSIPHKEFRDYFDAQEILVEKFDSFN